MVHLEPLDGELAVASHWVFMTEDEEKKLAGAKQIFRIYLLFGLGGMAFTRYMFDFPESEAYQGWALALGCLFFAGLEKRKISKMTSKKSGQHCQ